MKHIVFDCDGTLLDTSRAPYKLFPGIKELLLELSQDSTLYVWTARGRSSTLRILEELEVKHLFDSFYTADDGIGKPHALGLMTLVGSAPKNSVVMIGDTSNDILGAKNFGATSIGCIWNGESHADVLRDFGADFIATHPQECSKIIHSKLT